MKTRAAINSYNGNNFRDTCNEIIIKYIRIYKYIKITGSAKVDTHIHSNKRIR